MPEAGGFWKVRLAFRPWPTPWPKCSYLAVLKDGAASLHFHSRGGCKCLSRLDKPGIIGFRILLGSHPELLKKAKKTNPKKLGQTLAHHILALVVQNEPYPS